MFSSKSVVVMLIVCALACILVDSYVVPGVTEQHAKNICGGFEFVSPKDKDSIKNCEKFKFSWTKDSDAEIDTVTDIEIFRVTKDDVKYLGVMSKKSVKFSGKDASVTVKVEVPKGEKLPGEFFFRSWATSPKGPSCMTNSANITITK